MKTNRFFALFLALVLSLCLFPSAYAAGDEAPQLPADPDILAKAALLVDANTGAVVYAKNEHEELYPAMDPAMDAVEKLIHLNHELFAMIDGGVSMDLLARLLSTQLLARGEKHLLDRNRTYFKLLRQIITEGQRAGQLRTDRTVNEILRAYAMWERALMYDWCLAGGEYSLVAYTDSVTPMFLESYRGKPTEEK